MASKRIYSFGGGSAEGDRSMKELLVSLLTSESFLYRVPQK